MVIGSMQLLQLKKIHYTLRELFTLRLTCQAQIARVTHTAGTPRAPQHRDPAHQLSFTLLYELSSSRRDAVLFLIF